MLAFNLMYMAALQLNMTPVCRPHYWKTEGHGYVDSGLLLGCTDTHPPIGNYVPQSEVSGLTVKTARVKELLNATAPPLEENVVYEIPENTDCKSSGLHGSYNWYRQQYHTVRLADPARRTPECWGGGGQHPPVP